MADRRFNANRALPAATRRTVEDLKRRDPEAIALFERIRVKQLADHPPIGGSEHTAAQRANATQMANKAVAIVFLDWANDDAGAGSDPQV